MQKLKQFLTAEDGPTAVEYAIMLALIIMVCFASIMALTAATAESFEGSAGKIEDAIAAGA